ncbi:MAG: BMP family ABC transporter substrate-binding protein [Oscillatoriales cyanobacterium]|nr:MAG: BMP family ABC transporter substrate-binding protein [Oscillatoriales cyanobacterium]
MVWGLGYDWNSFHLVNSSTQFHFSSHFAFLAVPKSTFSHNPIMRRRALIAYGMSAAIGSLALSNCTDRSDSKRRVSQSLFKVAILFPRGVTTDDWCHEGFKGLQLIERELGSQVAYIDFINRGLPASLPSALDRFAKEGYQFIIGHSGTFRDDMLKAAARYPRTRFAIVASDSGNNRNFGALGYRNSELGYLLGAAAALQPNVKKVGLVTSVPTPPITQFNLAFKNALREFAPSVQLQTEWVGSFDDHNKAIALTRKLINQKIDLLAMNCWTNNPAIIELGKSSQLPMVVLGPDTRQLAPNLIIAQGLIHVPQLILHGAKLARRGRWEGRQYLFGLSEKVLEFALPPNNLSANLEKRLLDMHDRIQSGQLDVLKS